MEENELRSSSRRRIGMRNKIRIGRESEREREREMRGKSSYLVI